MYHVYVEYAVLCLVFQETANFPSNRSELYEEGLDVLLKKWDAKRNIERAQIYRKLSLQRKEDLLSQIALTTFERKEYFFKQKDLEQYIIDYIRNLPDVQLDPKILQLDSEAILKAIEAQHGLLVERSRGVYSFSHLTFHEYFAARKSVASQESLEKLATYSNEKRWREVFLLSIGMLQNADELVKLMKNQINILAASNPNIQSFLVWVNQQSNLVKVPYKAAAVRAFYFDLIQTPKLALDLADAIIFDLSRARTYSHELALALDSACFLKIAPELELAQSLGLNLELVRARARTLDLDLSQSRNLNLDDVRASSLSLALDLAISLARNPISSLQKLKKQQPDSNKNPIAFREWWQAKNQEPSRQLRSVLGKYFNIYYGQEPLLRQYYDANKLLIECLNSDCYVTRTVREEIEATLLLPTAQ